MTVPADVIILSSSPDPAQRTPKAAIYEPETRPGVSPPAPTPVSLLQLPSRSRFFLTPTAPNDATKKKRKSKSKAASSHDDDKDVSAKPTEKAKKALKATTRSGVLADLEPGSIDARKNVAKKVAGSQKGRSRSSAKSKEQGNMTLAGKVTKSSNEPMMKDASKNGKTTSAKGKSSSENQPAEPGKSNALEKDEDLHLDEAMRRRMDWTPPRETSPENISAGDGDDDDALANGHEEPTDNFFGKILSDYNYSGLASGSREIPSNALGEGPTKRRRIELVDPQIYPPPTKRSGAKDVPSGQEDDSSSSGAQVKKKTKDQKRFKTLTARMTAQYTIDSEDDDAKEVVVPDIGKAKSRRGKAKIEDQGAELVVLSPEAAVKNLNDQNLIFGTCSQLEREDSPETLRELQQATYESESLASQQRPLETTSKRTGIDSRQTTMLRLTGARNLWGVATRDMEGFLVQGRNLDLVDLTEDIPAPQAKQASDVKASAESLEDDWFDLDYGKPARAAGAAALSEKLSRPVVEPQAQVIAESTAPVERPQPEEPVDSQEDVQQPRMPHYEGFTHAELSKQVAAYGFKSVRGRRKMIELLQKCWESKHGRGSKRPRTQPQRSSQSPSRPTTSKPILSNAVTTQLASNGMKAKSKEKPTSKQREAKSGQTELATSVTPKKSSRKASKSNKLPQSSLIDVEEIQDSEEEVFLSPSQVQKRYTELVSNAFSSAPELSLESQPKAAPQSPTRRKVHAAKSPHASRTLSSTSTKPSTAESSKCSSLPDLLTQITKAIRAQPERSSSLGSRSRPTWHEKILMYDPVILEDLTTWLNVEGLGLVGEDREVGTATVREWCESKGICCCWKKNASW